MRRTVSYKNKSAYVLANDKQSFALATSFALRFLRSCSDDRYLVFFYHGTSDLSYFSRFITVSKTTSFNSSIAIMMEMIEQEIIDEDDPEVSSKLQVLLNYLSFEVTQK